MKQITSNIRASRLSDLTSDTWHIISVCPTTWVTLVWVDTIPDAEMKRAKEMIWAGHMLGVQRRGPDGFVWLAKWPRGSVAGRRMAA